MTPQDDGRLGPPGKVAPAAPSRASEGKRLLPAARGWFAALLAPAEATVGEPASYHEPPEVAHRRSVDLRTVLFALSGLVGTVLISASAPLWRLAVPSWRFTVPGIPSPGISGFVSAVLFGGGLILMVVGWCGIVGRAERLPGTPRRRLGVVLFVVSLWCIPVMLAPPLLSNDVYSYVAQGLMSDQGIDPTAVGPVVLGRGDVLRAVDPVWRTAPAPYGPAWVITGKYVVKAAGGDPVWSVWLFRLVAVIGVAMAAWGVALIARTSKVSPAVAVALAIGNPLVLLYLIGGIHNDALMMGFLALGVAAAMRDRRVLAVVLLSIATAMKLPAAAGLVFVGWYFAGPKASLWRRIRSELAVVVPAAAIVAGLCVVAGIGTGWITALQNTGKVMDTFSLTTILGYFGSDLGYAAGVTTDNTALVPLGRLAGLALAGAVTAGLLLFGVRRLGLPRALGLSMVAVVLLGPVVWPWYLPAGFALVCAAGLGRFKAPMMVVCAATAALVWPTSVYPIPWLIQYQRILSFLVIVAIAAVAWGAQRWYAKRQVLPAIDDVVVLPDAPDALVEPERTDVGVLTSA